MKRIDKGEINEIVYNNTVYYNGKHKIYPTITELKGILDEIISSDSTTEYIRITPFYINEEVDMQIEFEEFMFYIECRDGFDEKDQKKHILDCLNPLDSPRRLNDVKLGALLYPLCKHNDIVSYQKALVEYKESLRQTLPRMMKIAKSEMQLKEEHLPFGYFCFEIHNG